MNDRWVVRYVYREIVTSLREYAHCCLYWMDLLELCEATDVVKKQNLSLARQIMSCGRLVVGDWLGGVLRQRHSETLLQEAKLADSNAFWRQQKRYKNMAIFNYDDTEDHSTSTLREPVTAQHIFATIPRLVRWKLHATGRRMAC